MVSSANDIGHSDEHACVGEIERVVQGGVAAWSSPMT